jgi:hypothetical protein
VLSHVIGEASELSIDDRHSEVVVSVRLDDFNEISEQCAAARLLPGISIRELPSELRELAHPKISQAVCGKAFSPRLVKSDPVICAGNEARDGDAALIRFTTSRVEGSLEHYQQNLSAARRTPHNIRQMLDRVLGARLRSRSKVIITRYRGSGRRGHANILLPDLGHTPTIPERPPMESEVFEARNLLQANRPLAFRFEVTA